MTALTIHHLDTDALRGLEHRARRRGRPLADEVHDALLAATAAYAAKRGLSSHELHALTKGVAGLRVLVA